ncbi:MAG: glucose-1-phosphate adenylyltransferase subunit GlgD [Clostridiales bacterium]|jgi:glucose-1-phosphate adenylyltransferase|nr:glucose-1-phosphate adenylyltransferase subunit GlgD [Clostridiales bacterium]
MRANNVLGLVFSNAYDAALPELTNLRTMGSVPFGGRYRLIDFALSNMVNCGIAKVGIITKSNYQSLMDHVGSGKPWDLSRKNDGMFILPPFSSNESAGMYDNRIEALKGKMRFIVRSREEYIILCDCNVICNLDFNELFKEHSKSGADITIAYRHGKAPDLPDLLSFSTGDGGRITEAVTGGGQDCEADYSLNIYLMRKSLLERLINEAAGMHMDNFERDIIQRNIETLKIHGFEEKGFVRVLNGLKSYYDANMELLDTAKRNMLFSKKRPVLTKLRDEMPVIYGLGSKAKNSLIADGCIIDGEVENSILFRGARVRKGASVKNSIIMQGTYIGENVRLDSVVIDKSTVIKPGKSLCGDENYPVYIGKEIII